MRENEERGYLMKTKRKSKRRIPVLLSILSAGLVTAFLGGCAEGPYMTAYDGGYYRTILGVFVL